MRGNNPGAESRLRQCANYLIRHWYTVTIPLLAVFILAGLFATGTISSATFADNQLTEDYDLNESKIEVLVHERVNEARDNNSSPVLTMDARLRNIARGHSESMVKYGYYSHTSPNGATFEDRYAAASYDCKVPIGDGRYAVGSENLHRILAFESVQTESGMEYYDSEEDIAAAVVDGWMNSDAHREILLKDYWRNEGIGVEIENLGEGDGQRVYVTQNFC